MTVCMTHPTRVKYNVISTPPPAHVGPSVVFAVGVDLLNIHPSHKLLSSAKVCVSFGWN